LDAFDVHSAYSSRHCSQEQAMAGHDEEEGGEDAKAGDSLTRAFEVSQRSAEYRMAKWDPAILSWGKVEIQLFTPLSATVQVCWLNSGVSALIFSKCCAIQEASASQEKLECEVSVFLSMVKNEQNDGKSAAYRWYHIKHYLIRLGTALILNNKYMTLVNTKTITLVNINTIHKLLLDRWLTIN
jgi:hypothetical protein